MRRILATSAAALMLSLSACAGGSDGEANGEEAAADSEMSEADKALAWFAEGKAEDGEEVLSGDLEKQADGSFKGTIKIRNEDGEIEEPTCTLNPPSEDSMSSGYSCFVM